MAATVDVKPLSIVICPNCSLTVRGGLLFFGSLCAVSFSIGGVMAAEGLWPVLPFCGLEMTVLGLALRASLERRHQAQTITLTDAAVEIESQDRKARHRVVFARHWAQVKLRRPVSSLQPSRLTIESHGRQCELGSFLTEEERCGLALRLKRLIGRINESPSLTMTRN